VIERKLDNNEQ